MNPVRIYLIAVVLLMVIGVGFGVYSWYVLQSISQKTVNGEFDDTPPPNGVPPNESSSDSETLTLTFDSLTETERDVLATFGNTSDASAVTEEVVQCMQLAVGKTRFNEIVGGSAPHPKEAEELTRCTEG